MSEAEISNQLLALSGLALSGVSVFFTLFSAYIVALYFFLHRAPLTMRVAVFIFLTLAVLYLGMLANEMSTHAMGLHQALNDLNAVKPIGAGGRALLHGGDSNVDLRWMNLAGLVVNYLALLYLTFFYRWEH
ncbi:MAG: hypothetical protein JOZ72_07810 [Alphaproteobacteria bacterium]|nr:hypothetical protein [Alphaproteobacteria bacterium]